MSPNCFTPFTSNISHIELPLKFTYPFCYDPHPLCVIAAKELQLYLDKQQIWHHPFGLNESEPKGHGKMFGVLVVKNADGELGYLAGFSGLLAGELNQPGFVPPLFDRIKNSDVFKPEADAIADINAQVRTLSNSEELNQLQAKLAETHHHAQDELEALRLHIIEQRKIRKEKRKIFENTLSDNELQQQLDLLGKQSVSEKRQQLALKEKWQAKSDYYKSQIDVVNTKIEQLKEERRQRSADLQQHLFAQYQMLNKNGEMKPLLDIFAPLQNPVPPAGSGECAAPKMLQYAFQHQLEPICMAEFWWGRSPKSEIRQHQKYYPACQSKCFPILGHMLQGMEVDDNPLLQNPGEHTQIDIVYQDDAIVVINKPAELLSVPGVHVKDSALTRLQKQFGDCEGVFVLHRLDMSTSGLLVFALTRRANKHLQKQFITRQVQKKYVAVLEGKLSEKSGEITLPLRADLEDRPRQMVCFEHGKASHTTWQWLGDDEDGCSRVSLSPHTGRTHQLRVHCAHQQGLNMPIKGDDLYGTKDKRLHLHAEELIFTHPYTQQLMVFNAKPNF